MHVIPNPQINEEELRGFKQERGMSILLLAQRSFKEGRSGQLYSILMRHHKSGKFRKPLWLFLKECFNESEGNELI